MNKSKLWMNIRDSFWFVPAIYSLFAIVLVILLHLVDAWVMSDFKDELPKQLATSKDTAKKLYSTLVTAILTMTTISFSVIMVVLTTYSSQFSPRVLQDFMKSRFTQHVLGIFCSGFLFALILLLLIDYGTPFIGPILMVFVAIICLASFVYFIHHAARWLQVNQLIGMIKTEGTNAIKHMFNDRHTYHEYKSWDTDEVNRLRNNQKTNLTAMTSGYVQRVHWQGIVNWAQKHGYVVDLHVQVGHFVPHDFPLVSVLTGEEIKGENELRSCLIMGKERSDLQDVEFTIQKIVEIALRAISPSTNDPHTAINCINRIGGLLIEIASSYKVSPYLTDKQDRLRVIQMPKRFEDYLYKSFYQIKHYGQNDVSVMHSILEILYKVATVSNPTVKQEIWQFHYYIVDVIDWDKLSELDYNHLRDMYDKLTAACREQIS